MARPVGPILPFIFLLRGHYYSYVHLIMGLVYSAGCFSSHSAFHNLLHSCNGLLCWCHLRPLGDSQSRGRWIPYNAGSIWIFPASGGVPLFPGRRPSRGSSSSRQGQQGQGGTKEGVAGALQRARHQYYYNSSPGAEVPR